MEINNVIVDECIKNEMKFFAVEGNVDDVDNRWFGWSEVIKMVLDYKFEKGKKYCLYLSYKGNEIKEEDYNIDDYSEECFYDGDDVMLMNVDECTYIVVK